MKPLRVAHTQAQLLFYDLITYSERRANTNKAHQENKKRNVLGAWQNKKRSLRVSVRSGGESELGRRFIGQMEIEPETRAINTQACETDAEFPIAATMHTGKWTLNI